MITYMPEFYPDELLYSLLTRYYVKSGYVTYTFVTQELFGSSRGKPSVEFINQLSPEALSAITKNCSLKQVIMKHTMFPYYGRFLPESRRNNAYSAMLSINPVYRNHLAVPKRGKDDPHFLRYCPQCAKEDREKYGETYWHRAHQLLDVDICPIHKCTLQNSNVLINSQMFYDADSNVPETKDVEYCEDNIEILLAQYMYDVFQAEIDMDSSVIIGKYLHLKIKEMLPRGRQGDIITICDDFANYYKSLKNNRLIKLCEAKRTAIWDVVDFPEVCMFGLFLNISPTELANAQLPEKSITKNEENMKSDKSILQTDKVPDWEVQLSKDLYALCYKPEFKHNKDNKVRVTFECSKGIADIELSLDYVLQIITSRKAFYGLPRPFSTVNLTSDNIRRVMFKNDVIFRRKCAPTDEEIINEFKNKENSSVRRVAIMLNVSECRCRRVLIQNDLIPNPYAEQIGTLMEEGKTFAQIAKELGFSKTKVGLYAPKPVRKSYKTDTTINALQVAKITERKKVLREMNTEKLPFSEQLKKEIVRLGITKHKLAERIRVSDKKMQQWLSGKHDPDVFTQGAVLEKVKRMRPAKAQKDIHTD